MKTLTSALLTLMMSTPALADIPARIVCAGIGEKIPVASFAELNVSLLGNGLLSGQIEHLSAAHPRLETLTYDLSLSTVGREVTAKYSVNEFGTALLFDYSAAPRGGVNANRPETVSLFLQRTDLLKLEPKEKLTVSYTLTIESRTSPRRTSGGRCIIQRF